MERGKCRGCGAEIVWAIISNEKRMPLDATPEKRFVFRRSVPEMIDSYDTYVNHFATCPKAAEFRRRA